MLDSRETIQTQASVSLAKAYVSNLWATWCNTSVNKQFPFTEHLCVKYWSKYFIYMHYPHFTDEETKV